MTPHLTGPQAYALMLVPPSRANFAPPPKDIRLSTINTLMQVYLIARHPDGRDLYRRTARGDAALAAHHIAIAAHHMKLASEHITLAQVADA